MSKPELTDEGRKAYFVSAVAGTWIRVVDQLWDALSEDKRQELVSTWPTDLEMYLESGDFKSTQEAVNWHNEGTLTYGDIEVY